MSDSRKPCRMGGDAKLFGLFVLTGQVSRPEQALPVRTCTARYARRSSVRTSSPDPIDALPTANRFDLAESFAFPNPENMVTRRYRTSHESLQESHATLACKAVSEINLLAVHPSLSINIRTTSGDLLFAPAQCSGIVRLSSGAFTFAPAARHPLALEGNPRCSSSGTALRLPLRW